MRPLAAPEREEPPAVGDGRALSARRKWAAVVLLTVVAVLNYLDRMLPGILAEPMKRDLALTDTMLGFINGFGFLLVYALGSIPIARVADRGRHGPVIGICLTIWGAMTMLGGLTHNGWQFALARMGLAVGESGCTPATHAFIAHNFPPDRRAAPLAVLSASVSVGGMAGLLGGGLLAAALGWRRTFLLMGALSLMVAPLVFLALGARASQLEARQPSAPSLGGYRELLKKRSFVAILAGSAFIGIGGYALSAFAPAFLMRVHGMSIAQVGVQLGLAAGVAGVVALSLTGFIADRFARRNPARLLWLIAATTGAVFVPCSLAAVLIHAPAAALWLLAAAAALGSAYLAPVVAAIQHLAPAHLRASASAILLLCSSVFGGLGPLAAGMISDALEPRFGAAALARGLLVIPVSWSLGAAFFVLATRWFAQDMPPRAEA